MPKHYRGFPHWSDPPFPKGTAFGTASAPNPSKTDTPTGAKKTQSKLEETDYDHWLDRLSVEGRRYSRSDQEWEAAKALADFLRPDESVKRDEEAMPFVQQFMSKHGYRFSQRGFRERIWRDARSMAGLDRLGQSGPKKGSQR